MEGQGRLSDPIGEALLELKAIEERWLFPRVVDPDLYFANGRMFLGHGMKRVGKCVEETAVWARDRLGVFGARHLAKRISEVLRGDGTPVGLGLAEYDGLAETTRRSILVMSMLARWHSDANEPGMGLLERLYRIDYLNGTEWGQPYWSIGGGRALSERAGSVCLNPGEGEAEDERMGLEERLARPRGRIGMVKGGSL